MAKKCFFCGKELSKDNNGFLCKYHKDIVIEKGKKYGVGAGVAGTLMLILAHHPEEFMEIAKSAISKVTDNFD